MSEENKTSSEESSEAQTEGTPTTTEGKSTEEAEKKLSPVDAVLSRVKELIQTSGSAVRERVIAAYVEKKVSENAELLRKGLDKLSEGKNNLRKLDRPDVEQYGADGKPVGFMSKAKFEEVKKAKEGLAKLEKALELALEKNDFTKLNELCK